MRHATRPIRRQMRRIQRAYSVGALAVMHAERPVDGHEHRFALDARIAVIDCLTTRPDEDVMSLAGS